MSGGSDRAQFYLSGSSFDQKGIVIGARYQRQAGRANLDFTATDRLTLHASLGVTHENNARIEGDGSNYGIVTNAIGDAAIRTDHRLLLRLRRRRRRTSLREPGRARRLQLDDPARRSARSATSKARYAFTDWLSATGRAGVDLIGVDELAVAVAEGRSHLRSQHRRRRPERPHERDQVRDRRLSHARRTAPRQSAALVRRQARASSRITAISTSCAAKDSRAASPTYVRNAATITSYDGSATDNNLVSFFSRANWSLDRALPPLGAVFARDGSSRFGAEQPLRRLPRAVRGLASSRDEGFAQRSVALAARSSCARATARPAKPGYTGDFASLCARFGNALQRHAGHRAASARQPEPPLGDDARARLRHGHHAVRRSRIGIIADYYHRKTTDLLVQRPIAGDERLHDASGSNIGAIQNSGVDLGLNTTNIKTSGPAASAGRPTSTSRSTATR